LAGFLDKNERIVDMVLTNEGKRLLSKGDLRFCYFALFDDEVDYDPFIRNSGSLTADQLSSSIEDQIESGLVREAVTGYQIANVSGSDFTNVHRPLFTIPQGQAILPRMSSSVPSDSQFDIVVRQRKLQDMHIQRDPAGNVIQNLGPFDRGFERYDSSGVKFDFHIMDYPVDPENQQGFLVRVYQSGTEGLVEVKDRRDSNNDVCYNNDMKIEILGGRKTDAV
jgi:hypothetical protein